MERGSSSGSINYHRTHSPRSIVIGDVKEGFKFSVGQEFKRHSIEKIVKDESYFKLHGKLRVLIYVKPNGGGSVQIWKEIIDVPMSFEYEINY